MTNIGEVVQVVHVEPIPVVERAPTLHPAETGDAPSPTVPLLDPQPA